MAVIRSEIIPVVELNDFLKRYGEGKRRLKVESVYREMLAEAEVLARPRGMWDEFERDAVPEIWEWVPGDTVKAVIALCTLGPEIEERIDQLLPDAPHKAVVLDEISAAQVTRLALLLHQQIRIEISQRELKAGAPYRPGVGAWPLSVQQEVFALLPGDSIGLSLNDHLTMQPLKSTSMVIPVLDRRKG